MKEDILLKNIIMLIAIIAFGIAYPREIRRAILLISLFLRAVYPIIIAMLIEISAVINDKLILFVIIL